VTVLLVFLALPAAAYRLTRLIVKDTFPPVLWVRDRLAGGWRNLTMAENEEFAASRERGNLIKSWEINPHDLTQRYIRRATWSPAWLAELLSCPWCASAYVSAAVTVYGALLDWYAWPTALVVWFYVWAVAAITASKEWA